VPNISNGLPMSYCQRDNKPSASIKCWKFLDKYASLSFLKIALNGGSNIYITLSAANTPYWLANPVVFGGTYAACMEIRTYGFHHAFR
jgi:hypothetical protein